MDFRWEKIEIVFLLRREDHQLFFFKENKMTEWNYRAHMLGLKLSFERKLKGEEGFKTKFQRLGGSFKKKSFYIILGGGSGAES